VTIRFARHARQNVVAYIALMFSVIGGGGGYAIAATTHHSTHAKPTAVVACASKRSGELFLHHHGKCAKGRHKVQWSIRGPRGRTGAAGAAGSPAPSIYAAVDAGIAASGAQSLIESGMTVQRSGIGVFTITITDATCSHSVNVPVVTPTSRFLGGESIPPSGAAPVAYVDSDGPTQFTVTTGYVAGGSFTPEDYNFYIQDTCLTSGTGSAQR
jgi:hypothetical protein